MNLEKYQSLTGTTVAEGDTARYNAVIRRINGLLESALGYSLSARQNLYKEELGKVQFGGDYPSLPWSLETLLPPDQLDGEFRLFPYNEKDVFIRTDPYSTIYGVKLVKPVDDDEFVTFYDLNDYTSKNTRKFGKYIEKQVTWFNWNWYPWLLNNLGQDSGLLVAVSADWLTCDNMPTDLKYLWADMVDYYASDSVSVTGNIKSESVNGHSWSYSNAGGGKGQDLAPHESAGGLKTIEQYAGPNGTSATRSLTI